MKSTQIITGVTEEEIWQQVTKDLVGEEWAFDYQHILKQGSREVLLDIDFDLGGGFESGYESTLISAVLHVEPDNFSFAIHHLGFLDEIGKFFGMQDIETGYVEFDKKVVVKSNNKEKVKDIFSDVDVRNVFAPLTDFSFSITHHHISHSNETEYRLEFLSDLAITNSTELRKIYHAFVAVYDKLEG